MNALHRTWVSRVSNKGSAVVALAAFATHVACVASTGDEQQPSGAEGTRSTTNSQLGDRAAISEAVTTFDPCSSAWQLPTSARGYFIASDANFLAFESRLERGNARWGGSFTEVPQPYRAIVRVDHYKTGTQDTRAGLWMVATIPMAPTSIDALRTVTAYRDIAPVNSRFLGYCTLNNTFVKATTVSYSPKIKSAVVIYDPRCVCREYVGRVGINTGTAEYNGLPRY
jgi:hypothetical protein